LIFAVTDESHDTAQVHLVVELRMSFANRQWDRQSAFWYHRRRCLCGTTHQHSADL